MNEEQNNSRQDNAEYQFVKSVIKKKTIQPKDILVRILYILGGAVLFGFTAAFVFMRTLPLFEKETEPASNIIDFDEDSPYSDDGSKIGSESEKVHSGKDSENAEDKQVITSDAKNNPDANPNTNETADKDDSSKQDGSNETSGENSDSDAAHGANGASDKDDSSGNASNEDGNNPATETATETTTETTTKDTGSDALITEYSKMYDEMQSVAQNAMRSMVTVIGITSNEDWFEVQMDSSKQASGLIVANSGNHLYILTEYHVVENVERIVLTLNDGSVVDARYQMHDPNTGFTILKVDLADLRNETIEKIAVAELANSYRVAQGEAVIAIGSPMGYSDSVVYGQITSTTSTIFTYDKQYNLFTTNMLGNADGSGVLIDLKGNVVSVVAQSFGKEDHENIIVGLPISQLKPLIEILSNGGNLPCIGIKGQSVTEEVTAQTGMPKGVYVSAIKSNSPAFQAGIRNGDIITAYNGEEITTMTQYTDQLKDSEVGSLVKLTVMRKGTEGYREFEYGVEIGNCNLG